MKTKFFYLMMCLFVALGATTFTSCSDDENESENGNSQPPVSIVGTWRWDGSSDVYKSTYTFGSNGTLRMSYTVTQNDNSWEKTERSGTYYLAGNELVMSFTKEEKTYSYKQGYSESAAKSSSRTILSLTDTKMMWKYQYETESGDVKTETNSYTRVSN